MADDGPVHPRMLAFARAIARGESNLRHKDAYEEFYNNPDEKATHGRWQEGYNKNVHAEGAIAADYGYMQMSGHEVAEGVKLGMSQEEAEHLRGGGKDGKSTLDQQTKAVARYLELKYPEQSKNLKEKGDKESYDAMARAGGVKKSPAIKPGEEKGPWSTLNSDKSPEHKAELRAEYDKTLRQERDRLTGPALGGMKQTDLPNAHYEPEPDKQPNTPPKQTTTPSSQPAPSRPTQPAHPTQDTPRNRDIRPTPPPGRNEHMQPMFQSGARHSDSGGSSQPIQTKVADNSSLAVKGSTPGRANPANPYFNSHEYEYAVVTDHGANDPNKQGRPTISPQSLAGVDPNMMPKLKMHTADNQTNHTWNSQHNFKNGNIIKVRKDPHSGEWEPIGGNPGQNLNA